MRASTPMRNLGVLVFLGVLGFTGSSYSQTQSTSQSQSSGASRTASADKFQLLYTGRLMGYFRSPGAQNGAASQTGCTADISSKGSNEAKEFDNLKKQHFTSLGTILVGMGDNFAPEIEARSFYPAPRSQMNEKGENTPSTTYYQRSEKELFTWDGKNWVTNDQVNTKDYKGLAEKLANGLGTIPTDNAACFFIQEGYAALVPGKHDLYFGPERLRELARFLATPDRSRAQVVQLLASNLVITTTWKSDHKPLPDTEKPPWFIPRFPTARDLAGVTDYEVKLDGLSDGGTVYPWFQGPSLTIKSPTRPGQPPPDELTDFSLYRCKSKERGNPNEIPEDFSDNHYCQPLTKSPKGRNPGEYSIPFTPANQKDAAALDPRENYALCADAPAALVKDGKNGHRFCVRFSVYTPFFRFPWTPPSNEVCKAAPGDYCDPQPYVFLPKDPSAGRQQDVAIFGVLDPHLGEYVGMLNFDWVNQGHLFKRYKTQTAVKDPAEALKEMLAYFKVQHPEFDGIKILLAQMSPQEAKVLQTRLKEFQVVVSAADPEQATIDAKTTANWDPHPDAGFGDNPSDKIFPKIMAIPEPYYVGARKNPYVVDIGSLEITIPKVADKAWTIVSDHFSKTMVSGSMAQAKSGVWKIWDAVGNAIRKDCLPHGSSSVSLPPKSDDEKTSWIRLITVCSMQKELGADVALLQRRDLFIALPHDTPDISSPDLSQTKDDNLQPILDRIIWKGDFLTLVYLPGSALKKAMDQSMLYDADDASQISLSDEKGRGLLYAGIRFDKDNGEYLVNEVPLDPNRLYAVATSDYLSAGDTGYPDLGSAQASPPATPRDFDKYLNTISSVVCRRLAGHQAVADCLNPILNRDYFDEITMAPSDQRRGATNPRQLYAWSIFDPKHSVPGSHPAPAPSLSDELEQQVERRGLGSTRMNPRDGSSFVVQKASFSFNAVNHKFKDSQINTIFPGSTVPQITAVRSHTITLDLLPKYTYSWHLLEAFQAVEFRYGAKYTGLTAGSRSISQTDNLFSSDTGIVFHVTSRALPHVEPVFTLHYETLLFNPLANFIQSLATSSKTPPVVKDLSRTHLLLPRVGVRWVNRISWFEAGLEKGKEWNSVRIINTPVPPPGTGTNSTIQRPDIGVSGTFWKWHVTVPFTEKVSFTADEDGDYFFNTRDDNPTDTHFRSDLKSSVNFKVWPSLSFAPTYELFLYQNKVQGIWFWQGQSAIQMNMQFDIWNWRHRKRELKYAPPKSQ